MTNNAHSGWSLQRLCDAAGCGHRQRLTVRDLFTIMAKVNYGGTRKEAAFKCARCGAHNILVRQFLPRGVFESLPSLKIFESAPEPAEPVPADTPAPVPMPAPDAAVTQPPSPSLPKNAQPTPAKQPAAKPPEWIAGKAAFLTLSRALERSLQEDGDVTALGRSGKGELVPINLDFRPVSAEELLSFLDRHKVELLVLGGANTDGSRWKTIFHPHAGMASMVTEPIF